MKIRDERKLEKDTARFNDLKTGDVFEFLGDLNYLKDTPFLRTDTVAIRLTTSKVANDSGLMVSENPHVHILDAELVIR